MEQEYICLREEFLSAAEGHVNKIALNILKEYYKQSVDSNRKLSQIKDLSTLLDTLEKRDVLSYYNVEPLLYISNNFLNDFQIQSKLKNYQIYIQNMQYPLSCNMYQESNSKLVLTFIICFSPVSAFLSRYNTLLIILNNFCNT